MPCGLRMSPRASQQALPCSFRRVVCSLRTGLDARAAVTPCSLRIVTWPASPAAKYVTRGAFPQLPQLVKRAVECAALAPAAASATQVSVSTLLLASAIPVLKIAMLCSVGALCARKGLLTDDGRRLLSNLTFNVFVPCLFFTKLADFTLAEVVRLWPITANMVLSHVIGAGIGLAFIAAAKSPKALHRHLLLASTVGNVGNLPLVLVDSLTTGPDAMALFGPSAVLGMQYVMLGNMSATFIQFPLISHLLCLPEAKVYSDVRLMTALQALWQRWGSPRILSMLMEQVSVEHLQTCGRGFKVLRDNWPTAERLWDAFVTPPIISALLALAIGQLPMLKAAIFSSTGALRLVGEVACMLGDMAIPALMLVLGANLAKGPGVAKLPAASIVATAVARLLLLPLCGTAMVVGAHALGLLAQLDSTALVVMMLMHAVPTALMLHSVATMLDDKADELAAILFWQYVACLVTLPACMAFFLFVAAKLTATG